MTDVELIEHIKLLQDSAYTMLIKNSTDYHTILTGIKIESFDFVCNEMIKRLMSGNNNADK